jgi:hypothetical protein
MRILVLFFVLLFLAACNKDGDDDMTPNPMCESDNMSYNADILPILQSNCYACHEQGNQISGISLEGYSAVKPFADNGKLVGVINHSPGFPPMPDGGAKLPSCDIEKIESWVNDGAMNN